MTAAHGGRIPRTHNEVDRRRISTNDETVALLSTRQGGRTQMHIPTGSLSFTPQSLLVSSHRSALYHKTRQAQRQNP